MSRLFRISLMLAVFFGLEKVLGFGRQILIARQFGLSPELDAFNAANNIPDLLFALISGGALSLALIPVLSEYLETKGRPQAWELFSQVANLVFLVTAGLSILVAVLAPLLVRWRLGIAPGFDAPQQALVANLMRLNLFYTLTFSLSGLVIAGLQANQHFLLPAIAPAMYDIGSLIGVLVLAPAEPYALGPLRLPAFNMGIYGLVYGTIIGGLLFLGIQIPGLIRYKFKWTPALRWRDPGVQRVAALMGPRVLTVFAIQLVFLAQDNLASRLVEGSITALAYAWLIMQVPETLIGTALGTALLPTLSEQTARGETENYARTLARTVQAIIAITLPLAVLVGLALPALVRVFGFDEAGSALVVWTARAMLVGLIGHSINDVAARSFYARQDARTPLLAAGFMAVIFVLLAALLAPRLGAPGIALANALAFSAQAVLLLTLLNRRVHGRLLNLPAGLRAIAAAAAGGLLAYVILSGLVGPGAAGQGTIMGILIAAVALALGALAALPFIWNELKLLVRL